ncbi:PilZ domain-containing protein [Dasania marina]|uniref:PilZ domain-containing protein n=1 Tax=Dasania marina TaxID=471499 RepID=UPI0030D8B726|tara:strand:+ start:19868 stop:20131 length:264 start_codon:yes stop_codon:yes gene_type:complete
MDEQRKYVRAECSATVELNHPSLAYRELKARDLSDGGMFVILGANIAPPIGTVLKVKIKRYTGVINDEPVAMQVVHHNDGGVGLMFV